MPRKRSIVIPNGQFQSYYAPLWLFLEDTIMLHDGIVMYWICMMMHCEGSCDSSYIYASLKVLLFILCLVDLVFASPTHCSFQSAYFNSSLLTSNDSLLSSTLFFFASPSYDKKKTVLPSSCLTKTTIEMYFGARHHTQSCSAQTFRLFHLCSNFCLYISTFVFFYLDPRDQRNSVFQHLSRLSFSCEKRRLRNTGEEEGVLSEQESERKQHSRIHIIFLLSVTPWYQLAFPALSKVPSIGIPPSSPLSPCFLKIRFYLPQLSPISVAGN